MEKGEEVITLTITTKAFEELYNMGLIDLDEKEYKIKRIEPHEVEYQDD
jgi:glycine cleavage system H lipoate-binding protein